MDTISVFFVIMAYEFDGVLMCRHHHNGRWEARIGRVFGNKYLYLGTYGNFTILILITFNIYKLIFFPILFECHV